MGYLFYILVGPFVVFLLYMALPWISEGTEEPPIWIFYITGLIMAIIMALYHAGKTPLRKYHLIRIISRIVRGFRRGPPPG
jgi:hypothetical protein